MSERIPQDFIDDLIERVDIGEVIGRRVEIKKAGKEFKACCPFHNEKTPSFTISPEKGFYHCFGCGAHGTALGFLMDYERLTFVEAIEEISKMLGLIVPKTKKNIAQSKERESLKNILSKISSYYEKNLKSSDLPIKYLKSRGIDGKTAKHYALGYAHNSWDDILNNFGGSEEEKKQLLDCGLLIKKDAGGYYDRFRNRIMFPIRNNKGEIVGFGGRIIDDEEPKYLNSPETSLFKKGELLYGLYESKKSIAEQGKAIIVEGYTDVIGLYQNKIGNSLATLGTATTENHIHKVFRITDQIIFCFDGDNAGKKAAKKAMELCLPLVRKNKEARFLILNGDDPDDFIRNHGPQAFEKLIKNAFSMDDFLINLCNQESDIKTVKGKANAAENAMVYANKIRDGIYKDLVIKKISNEYGLPEGKLLKYDATNTANQTRAFKKLKKQKSQIKRPSLINQAIRILLNKPELAKSIDISNKFKFIDEKGFDIFREIIQLINKKEQIKLATIIEHFPEPKLQKYLTKIAMEKNLINENEWSIEFDDIIKTLERQDQRKELKKLIEKAKNDPLNNDDNIRLKELSRKIK
jgi:DNA primase|tara:strand:+ start:2816 stop:4555 length:1740 start_codon:yes stop_codon:yes gene_type:complete